MATDLMEVASKAMKDLEVKYQKGAILYPNLMRKEYKVGIEEMFQVFLILEKKKIVHRRYALVCTKCQTCVKESPNRRDFPNMLVCSVCKQPVKIDESLQMNFVKIV